MPTDDLSLQLVFQIQTSNGGMRELKRITYDEVQHRFLRFRPDTTPTTESPRGCIVFETCSSPSSDTQIPTDLNQLLWTEEHREEIPARTVAVTALCAELSSGELRALAPFEQAIFDNFQLQTSDISKGRKPSRGR